MIMNKKEFDKKLEQYKNLYDELDNIVFAIWIEAKETGYISKIGSMDSWDFSEESIIIKWSDSWQYGGYDEGTENFPIELMWSDYKAFFKDFADKKLKQQEKDKKKEKADKEKADRALYEKLKKQFNQS